MRIRRRYALPILASALALGTGAVIIRKGFVMTPDSWTYWEGSVTLLEQHRYAYIGGPQITVFPPLYSLMLAAAQAILGVSLKSCSVLHVVLIALSALFWTAVYVALSDESPPRPALDLALLIWLPVTIVTNQRALLSETLWTVILGALLLVIFARSSNPKQGLWIALLTGGLLACRNVSIAILPAIGTATFLAAWGTRSRAAAIRLAVLSVALPAIAWLPLRHVQAVAHPLGGARYTSFEYLQQMAVDVSRLLGRGMLGCAIVVATGLLVVLSCLKHHGLKSFVLLAFATVAAVGLVTVFSITWVNDPLTGRFVVFLAMLLGLTLLSLRSESRWIGAAQGILAVGLAASAIWRVGTLLRVVEESTVVGTSLRTVIAADYWNRPPSALPGGFSLVSPPNFAWIERRPDPPKDRGGYASH